ncbi:MAG: DUF448 domain-containing protein [Pseudomonadota bacterium]
MRKLPNETAQAPVRRCILTGERAENSALIRLALGPDNQVAPDVHARAPGRGAWVTPSAVLIDEAVQGNRLVPALKRAYKVGAVDIGDNLVQRIDDALSRALLDRLGLEARGGSLLTGAQKVETAARSGEVVLLLHASDARDNGRASLDQAWRVGTGQEGSGKAGIILPLDRDALSVALGRENVVHIALTDDRAADRVRTIVFRLLQFRGMAIPAEGTDSGGDAPHGRKHEDIVMKG